MPRSCNTILWYACIQHYVPEEKLVQNHNNNNVWQKTDSPTVRKNTATKRHMSVFLVHLGDRANADFGRDPIKGGPKEPPNIVRQIICSGWKYLEHARTAQFRAEETPSCMSYMTSKAIGAPPLLSYMTTTSRKDTRLKSNHCLLLCPERTKHKRRRIERDSRFRPLGVVRLRLEHHALLKRRAPTRLGA